MKRLLVMAFVAAGVFVGGVALGETLPGTTEGRTQFEGGPVRVKLAGTDLFFADRESLGTYVEYFGTEVIDSDDRGIITLVVRSK